MRHNNFYDKNFHCIDFVRFTLAFTVVIFHYKNFSRSEFTRESGAIDFLQSFDNWIVDVLISHGGLAVMAFWSISGFVFAHVYNAQRVEVSSRSFIINRIARLYPLHLLTLIYVAAAQLLSFDSFGSQMIYENNDWYHFGLQLVLASNWGFDAGLSFNGPIWSVSVEIASYCLFLVLIQKVGSGFFKYAAAAVACMTSAVAVDSLIPICGVYFFGGCAAYSLLEWTMKRSAGARRAVILGCVVGSCAPLAAAQLGEIAVPFTLQMMPLFAMLVTIVGWVEVSSELDFRILGRAGDMSYACYLLHTPLQITLVIACGYGLYPAEWIATPLFLCAYLTLLSALSFATFTFFERPAQRVIRRWFSARRRSSDVLAST